MYFNEVHNMSFIFKKIMSKRCRPFHLEHTSSLFRIFSTTRCITIISVLAIFCWILYFSSSIFRGLCAKTFTFKMSESLDRCGKSDVCFYWINLTATHVFVRNALDSLLERPLIAVTFSVVRMEFFFRTGLFF